MVMARNNNGNMLALITAAVVGIIILLVIFGLTYTRLIGSSSEQKTAIEAAALAAARDLSTIVVNTPEFGYVGLSDSAPNGAGTAAQDNYYTPVVSINTLIGTARLDYVIADQLIQNNIDVPEWQELAKQDYDNAKKVSAQLIAALNASITPSGSGLDKNGAPVTPYKSAEQAYMQNQIRMTGASNYQIGSMKLELGAVPGILTNIPVPKPAGVDSTIDSTNSVDNKYKAYTNVAYNGVDFYFAGIGSAVKLVDSKRWVANIGSIPADSFLPTVVRAEAVQNVTDSTGTNSLKGVACAMPASIHDPKPAPGLLTMSFPDGMPTKDKPDFPAAYSNDPKVKNDPPYLAPMNFYTKELMEKGDESDYYNSATGDYPCDTASSIEYDSTWPLSAMDPDKKAGTCIKLAIYDWVRRAGTKADVLSVVGMHTTPFLPQGPDVLWPAPSMCDTQSPIPAGIVHIYKFEPDGAIYYEAKDLKPLPFSVVADNQILVESHECLDDVFFYENPVKGVLVGPPIHDPAIKGDIKFKKKMDMYIRIYSRKPGDNGGGQHAGEPLDDAVATNNMGTPICLRSNSNLCQQISLNRPFFSFGERTCGRASFAPEFCTARGAAAKGAKGKANNVEKGALPALGPREDFMFVFTPPSTWNINRNNLFYRTYSVGSGFRPSYQANGIAVDIRFRRLFNAGGALGDFIGSEGYVIEK